MIIAVTIVIVNNDTGMKAQGFQKTGSFERFSKALLL